MIKKIILLLLALIINTNMVFACGTHQLVRKSKNYSKLNNRSHNKLQNNIKTNNKEYINK